MQCLKPLPGRSHSSKHQCQAACQLCYPSCAGMWLFSTCTPPQEGCCKGLMKIRWQCRMLSLRSSAIQSIMVKKLVLVFAFSMFGLCFAAWLCHHAATCYDVRLPATDNPAPRTTLPLPALAAASTFISGFLIAFTFSWDVSDQHVNLACMNLFQSGLVPRQYMDFRTYMHTLRLDPLLYSWHVATVSSAPYCHKCLEALPLALRSSAASP